MPAEPLIARIVSDPSLPHDELRLCDPETGELLSVIQFPADDGTTDDPSGAYGTKADEWSTSPT